MNVKVRWIENMSMLAESGSGHCVVMDGPEILGGKNIGCRPMEMMLMGMAGCSVVDVISILKKMREEVINCSAEIQAERAEKEPKIFTHINIKFKIEGFNIKKDKIKKAIDLSIEKYCSASIMLGKTAKIEHSFEIINNT